MSDSPSGDVLRVTALAKRFAGGGGIADVSLSVPAGSITAFIGVNGAGKSTTLRCILGLLRPDAGTVRIIGEPPNNLARARLGFLPEERGLFAHERARDAIAFHGRLKGMSKQDALAAADRLLVRIGLKGREDARIGTLSKGNAQRVQVLCALVHEPKLLLLDEPLSGLDPVAQAELLALLAAFKAKGGGVLFSTHSMAAAESICDRVVMLAGGRSVFEGTLAKASSLAPNGAFVVTDDASGLATAARSIGAELAPLASGIAQAARWRVILPRSVTHPALLRALAEHCVPIFGFEPIKADLEGAFWKLAHTAPSTVSQQRRAA
jgi:ABC-2 type transport system ATP-binding protein